MGYALSTFLCPADRILQLPGKSDDTSLQHVLANSAERLSQLDDQLVDEDDEHDISHEQALREIFSGSITAHNYGARYGWAFETICDCLGTFLPNQSYSPCDFEWLEQIDAYLETTEISLRFEGLVNNCPIEIPRSDDWPMIGHWTHAQILSASPQVLECAKTATAPEISDALFQVHEWLELGSKHPHSMIIGFFG